MSTEKAVEGNLIWVEQDRHAHKLWVFNLEELLPQGVTALSSVTWTVPAGLTKDSESIAGAKCSIRLSGGTENTWYALRAHWTAGTEQDDFVVRVFITADQESVSSFGSALFPNRFAATDSLRRDRLVLALGKVSPAGVQLDDDFLWSKLLAAEAAVKHTLRVPLQPTKFFPAQPSSDEISGLGSTPWALDPGYDYDADFFHSESWGHLRLRNKPLISVDRIVVRFPGTLQSFTIPAEWHRFDRKYADLQFIPTPGSQSGSIPLNAFMLQTLGMGRSVPFAIEVTYTAGVQAADFPELVDVAKKMAVLSVLEDKFMPTSGSISADGLSQSLSQDMEKHRDTIDAALNGRKGSNGGLMAAIHGVRMGVL